MRFFNTTLSISMLPDGELVVSTLSLEEAKKWLENSDFENVANPTHQNTLHAIAQKTGHESVKEAKGGRVLLSQGDEALVIETSGIPRETREFTDEEIAAATFRFRLVKAL